MLRTLTIAAMFALTGCASAVYDSLERRGVDAKAVLADRVGEARDDALSAAAKIEAAGTALAAAKGLDGETLAGQLAAARARAQDAASAAQDVRRSTSIAGASAARYFREWEEEIALYPTPPEQDAARARLKAQAEAHRKLGAALGAASLRLSPALALLSDEIAVLRDDATSGVVVAARADRIDAAVAAAQDASGALRGAAGEAERFIAALGG